MKEAITNLGKDQTLQLQLLLAQHGIDTHTSNHTQKYYRELRTINHAHHQSHPSSSLTPDHLMKTAIVIAEQSQPILNLNGQKSSPLCLALNQMISSKSNLKALSQGLKLYIIGSSKPHQQQLKQQLSVLQQQLSFGSSYIDKFQKSMKYFNFVCLIDDQYYPALFNSFSWLMFLLMQEVTEVNKKNHYQTDYLLIAVLYLMVRYAFDYLRPKSAPPQPYNLNNKEIIRDILNQLFQIFEIDHPQVFKKITNEVDSHFEKLIQKGVITCREGCDFLSPKYIQRNYQKIDKLYQKQHNPHGIDLRLLLQNRLANLTPAKLASKGPVPEAEFRENNKKRSFASHKILTFQGQQQLEEAVSALAPRHSRTSDIKLPQNVKVSPSYNQTPLICVRQPSPTSSLNSFMLRTVKNNKLSLQMPQNQHQILTMISSFLTSTAENHYRINEKIRLTYNFYLVLANQYLSQENWDEEEYNSIHCSCLVHSLLISSLASSPRSPCPQELYGNVKETLEFIRKEVAINAYQLWLICQYLQSNGAHHPQLLKETLCILESLIMSEFAWQEEMCPQIQHHSLQQSTSPDSFQSENMQAFIEHILFTAKTKIVSLISSFNLETQMSQYLQSQIYLTLKQLIAQCSLILQGQNLHIVILCACFLTLRQQKFAIKFNELLAQYQKVNQRQLSHDQMRRIATEILIYNQDQEHKLSIIQYYNTIFLPYAKQANIIQQNALIPCFSDKISTSNHHEEQNRRVNTENSCPQPEMRNSNQKPNSKYLQHKFNQTQHHSFTQLSSSSRHPVSNQKDHQQGWKEEESRDQTRVRARPSGGLLSCLPTEKGKSPSTLR